MTRMTTLIPAPRSTADRPIGIGAAFVDTLGRGEFVGLGAFLGDAVRLDALLPSGCREWTGPAEVCGAFEMFFGGMDVFEVVESSVGHVADRLCLRWRVHARGGRLGPEDLLAEQTCYVDVGSTGTFQVMSLVCSGFRPATSGD